MGVFFTHCGLQTQASYLIWSSTEKAMIWELEERVSRVAPSRDFSKIISTALTCCLIWPFKSYPCMWDYPSVAEFSKCSSLFLPNGHELYLLHLIQFPSKVLLSQYLLTDSWGRWSTILWITAALNWDWQPQHFVQPQVIHNRVRLPLNLTAFLLKVRMIKFIFSMRRALLLIPAQLS